ncbi:DUF5719 family protein [Nocardioides sp. zg-DK7169]|uniref:DUF5719 family protein n=1 Tax=Nocardioides sp. zg-DK7169 TaxID=2736600 RepID=UPI001551FD5F|nr:DUF5719 family protein [Nocardioides sp. zg-DK7169]NPC95917.1 hypothetical protein [Nocardioides sp. zg-DK7169]
MSHNPAGRRTATRRGRLEATAVLAVLAPVVTGSLLLLGGTDAATTDLGAPEQTTLRSATLGCPEGRKDGDRVLVATDDEASGEVRVGRGADAVSLEVGPEQVAAASARGPVTVRAEGDLAPGLVAGRIGGSPLGAAQCTSPSAETWFTGVGAGPEHSSVLELVNPGGGRAVADVSVLGSDGPVDADQLLGVVVPGGDRVRLDLAALLPRTDDLALQVVTTRGRVSASVLDVVDRIGSGPAIRDWLPGQGEPQRRTTLLGLADGPGARTLVIANPGESEAVTQVRVVTPGSTFAPRDLDDVRVPPQSVVRVSVGALLGSDAAKDAIGLELDSSAPVTASLRQAVDGDLTHAAPLERIEDSSAVLVPRGATRLVLADADATGSVRVVARDDRGRELADRTVKVERGRGASVGLPDTAAFVSVTPSGTSVRGAVVVSGDGTAVAGFAPLVRAGLVPDVRPGLPEQAGAQSSGS